MRLVWIAILPVVAIASVIDCVGDSSTPPVDAGPDVDLTGTEGHACFNGTLCNMGLTCISKVCVNLDSGNGDAGGSCDAAISPLPKNPCTDGGLECFPDGGCAASVSTCSGTPYQCGHKSECAGAQYCCGTGNLNESACPWVVTNVAGTTCGTSCSIRALCVTTADCPSPQTCHPASFAYTGFTGTGGVCQ